MRVGNGGKALDLPEDVDRLARGLRGLGTLCGDLQTAAGTAGPLDPAVTPIPSSRRKEEASDTQMLKAAEGTPSDE